MYVLIFYFYLKPLSYLLKDLLGVKLNKLL